MKVAFITESGFAGKVSRNFDNMRTDLAWMYKLDAVHYPFFYKSQTTYDIVITIIPKKGTDELFQKDLIGYLRSVGKKVIMMQEGPNDYWQDYSLFSQISYYNLLQEFDGILCHNEDDVKYYKGLIDSDKVFSMPSLMIDFNLKDIDTTIERQGVMIGGTMCSWYGGFDSLVIANEISDNVTAPSMGRKRDEEDTFESVKYLPYMNWTEWVKELNNYKYGVHLMRTFGAGTFSLNCSYLSIPCIAYENLDTQKILHPNLTVKVGDLKEARRLAKALKDEPEFYKYQSIHTRDNYEKYYSEDNYIKTMNEILKKF